MRRILIQIQLLLKLNLFAKEREVKAKIQIQLLLKLNLPLRKNMLNSLRYSNTTLVKVKFYAITDLVNECEKFKYNSC